VLWMWSAGGASEFLWSVKSTEFRSLAKAEQAF
jgi:hypothetical protein